ncbi:MAG: FAD:protein FMN transferase [Candidatus Hydrogenedentes bacterium]|nr:FAD:protein FMN transferase [Candidatus Hydrogenedentota bacterium]
MGTTYSVKITIHPHDWAEAQQMEAVIRARLDEVERCMSTYNSASELSQFNLLHTSEPFEVSAATAHVFAMAHQVSAASGGAFDVTVGPLVNAWGFGPEKREGVPSDDELAALRARVGYDKIDVDEARATLRKTRPDVYCDLSAIAKGYAVDRAAEALEEHGFHDYMVEVGGEVRTAGGNRHSTPWRIGIEKPDAAGRTVERVVPMSGQALATSGDYRNYYEVDGNRLSHTIDPRTGRPITHHLASVSVLHDECAMADAYATALMVLGPEEGFALAEKLGLAALFIVRDGPGEFLERETTAFTEYMAEFPADTSGAEY